MARIKNVTRKGTMSRERVRKYRKLRTLRNAYKSAVEIEIQRRDNIDLNNEVADTGSSDPSYPGANSDSMYMYNEKMIDFNEKLKLWAVKHCITKRAINDLLSILIIFGFDFLPKDSRTLMKTPKNVDIRELSKGQLWYYGIKNYLEAIFHNNKSHITVTLDFNFDGVALFNSSKKCFWPIIASIRGKYYSVVFVPISKFMNVSMLNQNSE